MLRGENMISRLFATMSASPLPPAAERATTAEQLLKLAHACLSGVLQFDYLSNGAAHRQSTAVLKLRANKSIEHPSSDDAAADAGHAIDDEDVNAKPPASAVRQTTNDDIVRRYLAEISKRRRLSSSEEYRLARSACDGNQAARQRLIEHHLGFVVMIARRYSNRGLPLLDLIEEGNIGLMTAIEKFDPELGHRFSTYAKWWVRQSIELALMTQTRVVHLPMHVARALKRMSRDAQAATSGEDLNPNESADASSEDIDGCDGGRPEQAHDSPHAERSVGAADHAPLRDQFRYLLFDASNQPEAADGSAEEDSAAMLDALAAPEHEQPDSRAHLVGQKRRLHAALSGLNDNERIVIESRFGLINDTIRTLDSIAAELKLSSERVRQIQAEALRKLHAILLAQGLERSTLL